MLCAGSMVLPRVERTSKYAARGTAIHSYIATALSAGRAVALAECPEEHREICSKLELGNLVRLLGGHPLVEPAYVYNVRDDSARFLGQNIGRDYGLLTDVEIPGTDDLVAVKEDSIAIADVKTGHYIGDAADSWQLKALALAVSRHYGKDTVDATLIRLRDDGSWYYSPTVTWTAFDLDGFASELQSLYLRIKRRAVQMKEEGTVDVHPSDAACQFCPCVEACPAHTALARHLPPTLSDIAAKCEAMSDSQLAESWDVVCRAEEIVKRVKDGLKTIVKDHPVKLASGKTLTAVLAPRETIDPEIARKVLTDRYGSEVSSAVFEVSASKKSIKAALNGKHEEALEAIRAAGGITVKYTETVKEV